ncbi:MAG: PA2169 family four-helix-bundle protein [Ardenticatenaceae bacterium]|nr:PA2169 family four-helix-bundle protein [Ardenticatenaceae bacterium]
MNNQETIKTLQQLHKLCKAGERGFNIIAKAVNNRGLKVMLKTYAQQRRQMADDLRELIETMGGTVSSRHSLRGMIHRGRIAIMTTLAIGPMETENVALKEAVLGEKTAVATYQNALKQNLAPEVKALVEQQYAQIQAVSQKVQELRGVSSDRLVVRLFNSERDAETAVATLANKNFPQDAIETINLSQTNEFIRRYNGEKAVTKETTISGGLGGAIWGSILGAAAGVGLLQFTGIEPFGAATMAGTWGLIALSGTFSGLLIGAILGFFIGLGVSEQDAYLYDASIQRGTTMVLLKTNPRRAPEASQIMRQVNLLATSAAPQSGD